MTAGTQPINLADPALYADGRQFAAWSWLRDHQPVRWQRVPGEAESGYWAVTRYADVERVLRDHDTFTSERGTLVNLLGKGDPAAGAQLAATDPPKHDRLRAPLQKALGARPIEAYSDEIQAGIRGLLAPGLGGRPFDFASAMARLPMIAMTPFLGLPSEDADSLVRLVAMCNAEEDPDFQVEGGASATLQHGHRELFAYFSDLARLRRRNPGNDLVTYLITTEVDGEIPPVSAVISNCYSMLLGAAGTLPHVPTAAVVELARTGGYRDWATHPELLDSGVEEALRWAAPASNFMRYARRSVTLSGFGIAEGDAVVAYLGSANRDPDVFPEPETFNIRRAANRHFGFGVGHHYCVGSHLARHALRLLFAELFATFSEIAIIEPVVRIRSTFLNGIKGLTLVGVPAPGREGR